MNIIYHGILAIAASCIVTSAFAQSSAAPSKSLPKEVTALTERIVGCNHWLGETPYDAERSKEIKKAIKELRCSSLVKDEARILKRYGADPAIQQAIAEAKETAY